MGENEKHRGAFQRAAHTQIEFASCCGRALGQGGLQASLHSIFSCGSRELHGVQVGAGTQQPVGGGGGQHQPPVMGQVQLAQRGGACQCRRQTGKLVGFKTQLGEACWEGAGTSYD